MFLYPIKPKVDVLETKICQGCSSAHKRCPIHAAGWPRREDSAETKGVAPSNHNHRSQLCNSDIFQSPHILGKLPCGIPLSADPTLDHADSRVRAQTPFTTCTTNIHKPTGSGPIHDGLRAASDTFVRPAPARAAHAGLLQRAAESNHYLPAQPTTAHATPTPGLHHLALPRTLLPGAATCANKPFGPQLSSNLRRSTKHAPTVVHHARSSGGHGYRRRLRAAELRLSHATDLDGGIAPHGRDRREERADTTVASTGAEPDGTPTVAGLSKPQDVPRSHGTLGQQPARTKRADGDDGPPTPTKLCPSPDAAASPTSTTPSGFSRSWPRGRRRGTTVRECQTVPSHPEATRGPPKVGRGTPAHLKRPQALPARVKAQACDAATERPRRTVPDCRGGLAD